MNGCHIRQLSLTELAARAEPFWPTSAKAAPSTYRQEVVGLLQERLKFLAELPQLSVYFFETPDKDRVLNLYQQPVDKMLKASQADYLSILKKVIEKLRPTNFTADGLQSVLNSLIDVLPAKPGVLFPIIRIAISGSAVSPELSGTLAVLGKKTVLERLDQAVVWLQTK